MTKIDVTKIAKLANIQLAKSAETMFGKQLSAVLSHIESLSEVNIDTVAETSQVTGLTNVSRTDEVLPSLTQENAVNQAKNTHNNLFVVPILIEAAVEE